jgi:hypothetical protein
MKNKNQLPKRQKNPELQKPTILAWGLFENFISGDEKTDPQRNDVQLNPFRRES